MAFKVDLKCERLRLDNGLILLLSESRRIPLVSLNAFVLAGLDQNPLDQPGLASLTARLLDEGTQKYDYLQIARIVEGAGGAMTVFSQRELSGISLQIRSEHVGQAIELVAEMLRRPVFPSDRVELEKEKVLNHLRALEDEPQSVAGNLFNQVIYEGTPFQYPVLGESESLGRLNRKHLAAFHRRKYAPPATILVVTGDISARQVSDLVQECFGDWRNPEFNRFTLPSFRRQKQPIAKTRRMDKEQVHILIGHLGVERSSPDHPALQVLDVILGSGPGFTSRLPRKLRDEQGLAYTTFSDIAGSSGLYPGRFMAYICTSPDKKERALSGLLSEIAAVVESGVTPEELETAQDFLTGSFVFELQSNHAVARFVLGRELFQLGEDYAESYPRIIRALDGREVERVARRYLDTVNYTTVLVGSV